MISRGDRPDQLWGRAQVIPGEDKEMLAGLW